MVGRRLDDLLLPNVKSRSDLLAVTQKFILSKVNFRVAFIHRKLQRKSFLC